jgi:hypothetical protein
MIVGSERNSLGVQVQGLEVIFSLEESISLLSIVDMTSKIIV